MATPVAQSSSAAHHLSEAAAVQRAKKAMTPCTSRVAVSEHGVERVIEVERRGVGPLLTKDGVFYEYFFHVSDVWGEYAAIVKADCDDDFRPVFAASSEILIRTDSGCATGQVFGDMTCDCCEQLHLALATIARHGQGMVVHIPAQDGRGLGLGFKLATLMLQAELGVDTVEASALLDPEGATRDQRSFAGVIAILQFFGLDGRAPIRLLSNNPQKLAALAENGFTEARLRPLVVAATNETRRHFAAKQRHFGHIGLLPESELAREVIGDL